MRIIFLLSLIFLIGCNKPIEKGVSLDLAESRKEFISDVKYSLNFSITKHKSDGVKGNLKVEFQALKCRNLILDFREDDTKILLVSKDNQSIDFRFENGHIIIPSKYICIGKNSINIDFIAGESSLNRKNDFLYTLLVPDRASTLFPCFDQPNLKGIYKLRLDIPKEWKAVANGGVINQTLNDSIKSLEFDATEPISTYLFAFVAGRFDTISRNENGRKIVMYYRESDSLKVKRNLDVIFSSHYHSLAWLKDYTGIDYPFGKLDIILIPDFQYGGMEHPGAIYYRDSQLFLDEKPSVNQQLRQANLIAHEVSHQWFGDLVTMRWFNDVWLKEVFAGLMADKIVNPQFSNVNHNLRFFLSHYPRAYSIDRAEGANPIRQDLDNLLFAGTLYGDIIYHKAPVMMMQLEMLMGEEPFKNGLRQYLSKHRMGNADWEDLISILDPLTEKDLVSWSKAWVEQPGLPTIWSSIKKTVETNKLVYSLQQTKDSKAPVMGMSFSVSTSDTSFNCQMVDNILNINIKKESNDKAWILSNSDGKGYGAFFPDSISLQNLLGSSAIIKDDVARASWFVTLNELFLNGKVDKSIYFQHLASYLVKENEPQIRQYLLDLVEQVWWKFFDSKQRLDNCKWIEEALLQMLSSQNINDDERKPIFSTYVRIAISNKAVETIFKIWNSEIKLKGLLLDESDFITLSYELAVRGFGNVDSILKTQELKIKNTDRLAKFKFIRRAVSDNVAVRDSFFYSLSDVSNRRPESWVIDALRYLNHPLRAEASIKYLQKSLDLLPEIQKTGDIFFPKSWLESLLWGYNSNEAYSIVDKWLTNNPNVSKTLFDKVRQSSDLLKRSVKIVK